MSQSDFHRGDACMRLMPGGWFAAHNATVAGDVTVGAQSSFWFQTVARGDVAPIVIGRRVNVQDGAIIHCETGQTNVIEDEVSIGHGAVIHGSRVGRGTLVGMRAVLLGGTAIGSQCLIAAGAVVPPGMVVPDRKVLMGVPAKIVREVSPQDLEYLQWIPGRYLDLVNLWLDKGN